MKTFAISLFLGSFILLMSCGKDDDKSDRFRYLTGAVWQSDSLLINGEDATGEGQMLEPYKGDAIFYEDGTGVFGSFNGTWRFAQNETELVLDSDSLAFPLTTKIQELIAESLKVTATIPNFSDPQNPMQLRMTFKAK